MSISIIGFLLLPLYGYVYFILLQPPEDWLTHSIITISWCLSGCSIVAGVLSLIVYKYAIDLYVLRCIRVCFTGSQLVHHVFYCITASTISYYHGHILTGSVIGTSCMCICLFYYNFCVFEPMTKETPDNLQKTQRQILNYWRAGDFDAVLRYLNECDAREIITISRKIEKNFGPEEYKMFSRLLS